MRVIDRTFFTFLLVGVVNTLVGSAVMFAAYNWLGWGYWTSSAANYIVGSAVSYLLNKRYTFQNRERGLAPLGRFVLSVSVCYLLAYGVAKPLVRALLSKASPAWQDNGAMLVGMVLFVLLNYLGQRFFAFRKADEEESKKR